jgi:hypothetical protein
MQGMSIKITECTTKVLLERAKTLCMKAFTKSIMWAPSHAVQICVEERDFAELLPLTKRLQEINERVLAK